MTTDPRPSVTFLCSAYRTERTVVQTIESVLAQTRTDWQLVVVDNGPSEEMARLVEPFTADPRITMLRQDNARAAGGVNAAAGVAEGRYVAVLHSDDLVLPDFVEVLVDHLDRSPEVAALAPDAHYFAETGMRRATYRSAVPDHYRREVPVTLVELIEGWVPYYTAPVRREVWEEIGGFRTDAPSVEDLALWCDLLVAGHVLQVLERPLAAYREDENSDSRGARGVEVMEESRSAVITEAVRAIGGPAEEAALEVALTKSRHRRGVVRARRLLLEGDPEGARAAAEDAARARPDLRTRAMALALRLSPGLLLTVYRLKKAVHRLRRRITARGELPTG